MVSGEDLESLKDKGFPVYPGALGENLTVTGLDFRKLRLGMRFRAGEAVIELTKFRVPCDQLDPYNPGEREDRIQSHLYDKAVKGGDVKVATLGDGRRLCRGHS